MNRTLGERHLTLAGITQSSRTTPVDILERSNHKTWTTAKYSDSIREYLDFTDGISGDDLARINAFEPADPKIKPIGNQSGLWSAVKEGARHVRSAA